MRILIAFLLCFTFVASDAQESKRKRNQRYGRKSSELVKMDRWRPGGWHFAPGVDYTLTRFKNKEETLIDRNDTLYNATFDPGGKFGLYFEFGRYRLFKYGTLFNYMDYSVAYKAIKGTETFTGDMLTENGTKLIASNSGEGAFKHKYILGNFNLNNIIPMGSYNFIQNSIGLNLDYRFKEKNEYSGNTIGQTQADPSRLLAQLHYKFGFGFKVSQKLFIIPTLETPILNIFEWDKFKSTDPMFSSRYRPIILTVRIAWLKKPKTGDCLVPDMNGDERNKQKLYDQEK